MKCNECLVSGARSVVCAAATAISFVASAVEVVDLTAAARAAGSDSYEVYATSTNGAAYSPSLAFDGTFNVTASRWLSNAKLDQCLGYHFRDSFEPGKYLKVTSYALGSGGGWYGSGTGNLAEARMPRTWTFDGSNDGENWTTIDSRTGEEWVKKSWMERSYDVATPGCYRYYRLHMTERSNNTNTFSSIAYQLGEVKLKGKVLVIPDEEERTLSWNGGTAGDWNVAANWTNETSGVSRVPADGDMVEIAVSAATTVRVSESTANLHTLRIGGGSANTTLETTNWTTCVSASNMIIASKGIVTCSAGGTNEAAVSRVWLKGHDITIYSGGKIDVDYKGYGEAPKSGGNTYNNHGYGPAGGLRNGGAAHGGYGGRSALCNMNEYNQHVMPCDDPEFPSQPGSSGSASYYAVGKAGGGAVRIEATSRVTVDGTITANGRNVSQCTRAAGAHAWNGSNHETAGAGGAIWITCKTFAGNGGTLRADGGWGDYACPPHRAPLSLTDPGAAAGGGMIAVHYDAAEQTDGLVSGMTFSVAPGFHAWAETSPSRAFVLSSYDRDAHLPLSADLGTLWFTDAKLLESLGRGITGQIVNAPESMTLDSLEITSGWFRFARDGFTLNVTGDMTVSGKDSCYEVGGVTPTNRTAFVELYSAEAARLNVGGRLTVADKGRLDVHAADTNRSGTAFGAYVQAGEFVVGSNGVVYAWSDPVGGGSPRFDVAGDFTVCTGGLVSAEWRGYAAGYAYSGYPISHGEGYGPGRGKLFTHTYLSSPTVELFSNVSVGGGHGGEGGWQDAGARTGNPESGMFGRPYDDEYRPVAPGSGGPGNTWTLCGGAGGGVVYVKAGGAVRVDGEVNVDGGFGSGSRVGGGAGGSIFLYGATFFGGETAVLSAKGNRGGPGSAAADSSEWSKNNPDKAHYLWMLEGAGGGGRIAIWTGLDADAGQRVKLWKNASCEDFLGTATAAGGVNPGGNILDTYGEDLNGKDGTVRFVCVGPAPGMSIMVR